MLGFVFASSDTGIIETATPLFVADLIEEEKHDLNIDITTLPVEGGTNIGDNANVRPDKVTMTILSTNAQTGDTPKLENASATTFAAIKNIAKSLTSLTIITSLEMYANMMIENVNTSVSNSEKGTARAVIKFKEVQTAALITTELTVKKIKPAAKTIGADTAEKGAQPTRYKSGLKKAVDGDISYNKLLGDAFKAGI